MEMFQLKVTAIREVAAGIHEYTLSDPEGGDLPAFTPGAHIHVAVPSGGTRQYSLLNDPAERSAYRIAIKLEAEGKGGSTSFIAATAAGDSVEVSAPVNDFELRGDGERIVLIAGGIGITPILSMAQYLLRTAAKPFEMIYLTREPGQTAYLDEVVNGPLAPHVTLHHDMGDPANSLDLAALLAEQNGAVLYCCGPTGLLHAVRAASQHWERGSVRFEDFGTTPAAPAEDEDGFQVRLEGGDQSYWVPEDKSILDVLNEAGLDMPSSCESGTCGTCRMRLVEGEADHRDLVLFDDEMDDSIIICCSRAKSREITIGFPA
ncbi:PDR/VanB family oxidoreductase [Sinisalibacter aestuarii]|uniref:Iron-sulfur protein n=1 Tax=Sinisalibacter aestuarii TaxID=2949426 RepID=A0ABQ5LYR0_9RHOB|nr:PDR/VanB family oxidoreductase [Sinisalibacter aestuarii]GKY90119.1 iron-sulfur protein [Sinisalibacter aestuarii]